MPPRQGWRADKTITSFHKNRIFVKTRKVMGNTDVAHYRGQLATTLSSFCSAKTRSSKIGAGRRSIYNICILNDCKLTFEFFKNYIFEKRRQFLNRILGRNIRGFEQQAEWIEHLNMLVSIKILARILMLHIGCTFGEWCEKLFTRQNQKNYINCVRTGF